MKIDRSDGTIETLAKARSVTHKSLATDLTIALASLWESFDTRPNAVADSHVGIHNPLASSGNRGHPVLEEFKKFILRGNVVDLAVGLIIGAAFGAIVSSLVSDVLMPPIGAATGGVDFRDLAIDLPGKMLDPATADKPPAERKFIPVKIKYGNFIQKVIDFLIVGFCLFTVIKVTNKLQKKKEDAPHPPSASEKLLMEIRDLLAKK